MLGDQRSLRDVPGGWLAGDDVDRAGPSAGAGAPEAVASIPFERAPPSAARLQALAEILLCSGLPTQLLVIGLLALAGMMPAPAGGLSLRYVVTLLGIDAVLLVGLVFFLVRRHGESPRRLFLGRRRALPEAGLGLLLAPPALLLAMMVLALLRVFIPSLQTVPRNPLEDLLRTRQDAVIFAFVAMVGGGVREEVQRAFILHRFEQHLGGATLGVILFSAAFGAGHLLQGADVAVTTAVLGALWGIVYLWRRSIVAPVVCHAAFNLVQVLAHRVLS